MFKYLLATIAALALLAGSLTANAKGAEAKNIRVIDGDSFACDIDLGFGTMKPDQRVRVYGFDAWESTKVRKSLNLSSAEWEQENRKGVIAKRSLENLLKFAKVVRLHEVGHEQSFSRWVVEVYADETHVADYMKSKGHERSGGVK